MGYSFFCLLHCLLWFASSCFGGVILENYSRSYGVVMVTIPPRFPTVHQTIISLQNQLLPPAVIVIFIPKTYRRFRKKGNSHIPHLTSLNKYLSKQLTNLKNIFLVEQDMDLGPALRYLGMFELITSSDHNVYSLVTHWMVCDDDVHYANDTVSAYDDEIRMQQSMVIDEKSIRCGEENCVLTHYVGDSRVRLGPETGLWAGDVFHLQGVDTILFPSHLVDTRNGVIFQPIILEPLLNWLHALCPYSFFQDDYVISLLVHIAHLPVKSIWKEKRVAGHIENVSTSNFQMHLHEDVFWREIDTRECLSTNFGGIIHKINELLHALYA